MAKRRGPTVEDMEDNVEHTHEHKGASGKFGDYFLISAPKWTKISEDEHLFMVVPYLVAKPKKSPFRKNVSLNKPFSKEHIKNKSCWDWKLSVLVHYNIGPNQDSIICPRTIGMICPICEYLDTLDYEKKKEKKIIDRFRATKRGVMNVKVLDSNKERKRGVQLYEAPHQSIIDEIATKARSKKGRGFKNFALLSDNWDISYERNGTGLNTKYLDVDIVKRSKKDRVKGKAEAKLLASAYNLEEIVEVKDAEEIQEMFDPSGTTDSSPKKGKKAKKDKKKKGKTLEKPQCFGLKCGKIQKCHDCPPEIWEGCYKIFNDAKKKKKKKKGKK